MTDECVYTEIISMVSKYVCTYVPTQWFQVSPSGPQSARGSITRKMVRKRAVSRVYTSGMGDLVIE